MDAVREAEILRAFGRGRASDAALSVDAIAARLDVPKRAQRSLQDALDALVEKGTLTRVRATLFARTEALGDVVGRFDRHPIGYGFVIADDPREKDVYVAGNAQGDALHGDVVSVSIIDVKPDGRREGRIVAVLERQGGRVVGVFHRHHAGGGVVEPIDQGSGFAVRVRREKTQGALPGELVTVALETHPDGGIAKGAVIERLGPQDEPGTDVLAVMRRYGLLAEFPQDVEREAARLAHDPERWPIAEREDFRESVTVTIDGADAKDFDDAVSVDVLPGGGYRLFVHIADVAHFVCEGGALDREARRRGTSVYFPGRVVPMLPPAISDDLCSLRPHVPRLTQSVVIDFDHEARALSWRFVDGVIRSQARLTYDEVSALLEDGDREARERLAAVAPMLERAAELARLLIRRRARRGAIDFDLPEPAVVMDDAGRTIDVVRRPRLFAHRLIEEFMIAANEAAASELVEAREPGLHRVHERPDVNRIAKLADLLGPFGYEVPAPYHAIEPEDLAALVLQAKGQPEEPFINRLVLRSLALARYDPQSLGHFGLALSRYAHFTSPIRRYPDLVVHRALRRLRAPVRDAIGERRDRRAAAVGLGVECSRLEREAEAAEREVIAWKVAALLATRVGEVFEGVIVEIAPWGLGIALDKPAIEASLPVARLGPEFFRFDARKQTLTGTRSGVLFKLGRRLRVLVDRVDALRHAIELALPEADVAPTAGGPRDGKGSGAGGAKRSGKNKRTPKAESGKPARGRKGSRPRRGR